MITMPLLVCAALAPADVPTKADIAAAWQRRLEAIPYVEMKASMIHTVDMKVQADLGGPPEPVPVPPGYEPVDEFPTGRVTYELSLHLRRGPEGLLWAHFDLPVFNYATKRYFIWEERICRGPECYKSYSKSPHVTYGNGMFRKRVHDRYDFGHGSPLHLPWLVQVYPFDPSTDLTPDLQKVQSIVRDPGDPGLVIAAVLQDPNSPDVMELTLDPARDYLPTAMRLINTKNQKTYRIIEFSDPVDIDSHPFFQRWTTTDLMVDGERVRSITEGRFDIIRLDPIRESEFEFAFPVGTNVVDVDTKEAYHVDEDGKLVAGRRPRHDMAQQERTESNAGIVPWLIGGVVLLVVAGTVSWFVTRKHRKSQS